MREEGKRGRGEEGRGGITGVRKGLSVASCPCMNRTKD